MSTLVQLIAALELELKDAANAQWTADELTAHIRRALSAYNRIAPRRMDALLATTAGVYEYSLTTLGELLEVTDVWYPWDAANPTYPPVRPPWSILADGTIDLEVEEAPDGAAAAQVRIFYTTPHTVSGLDGETITTLDGHGEELVLLGAAAYAAMQMAQSVIGKVTASTWTSRQYQEWATARVKAFEVGLERLRRRAALAGDPRVAWRETL